MKYFTLKIALVSLGGQGLVMGYRVNEGVNIRSGPGTQYSVVGSLAAGADVQIICQTTGEKIQTTNIWDKVQSNGYVSDYYVQTNQNWVPGVPRCDGTGGDGGGSPNNGQINNEGLALVKEFEGFYANFYTDPVGIKTIGYGHACHTAGSNCDSIKPPISEAQGSALLRQDLAQFEKCIRDNTAASLDTNQFSALVSFAFNLGCGAYRGSDMRTMLNNGNINGAASEFKLWVHGGGKVLPGLVRRRKAECQLFCKSKGCSGSC
ncbi:hypothetical protein K7432_001860 [Basidiobolus ranarum]|uniref:SH3b domain-containing protein n=1 Tax=Basidiobolus ranarum TaxID=34480 RepID=A0ABR2W8S8_9FUNG